MIQLHRPPGLPALLLPVLLLLAGLCGMAHAQQDKTQNGRTVIIPQDDQPAYYNAFTPNGDGIIDVFIPSQQVSNYTILVYDRWGNEVYSGTQAQPWAGQGRSGQAPEGVYVYQMRGRTLEGDSIRHVGTITLLR
ncbi:MAG: gliding motility-associated C-terminal domain-containing protein [Sphingobacteriia bacterium]